MRIDFFTPRGAFVFRSALGASLALGAAYALQFETPYSAASTVLLIANANHGAMLAKGAWRVAGTVLGIIVAITLMALFAQMPALFILGFGIWLGICAAGATIFRQFKAYGAAVAGYTVAFATYGSFARPQLTLEHALGRGATVLLGVLCLGVVTKLLQPRDAASKVEAKLTQLIAAVGDVICSHLQPNAAPLTTVSPELVAEMFGVDDLLALNSAESADMALRAYTARQAAAALFAALVSATSAGTSPALTESAREIAEGALRAAIADLRSGAPVAALSRIQVARDALRSLVETADCLAGSDSMVVVVELAHLAECLEDYEASLNGLVRLGAPRPRGTQKRFSFHVDSSGATENGLRACLAVVAAAALWAGTAWPQGDLMLVILAPYCVLAAMDRNPASAAREFTKGTILAVPASFVCAFVLLPNVSGFPLLVTALAPFWIVGLYAMTTPVAVPASIAYLVAFNTLVGATNPMVFNPVAFLNQAAAWIVAMVITMLSFSLMPRDSVRGAARIMAAIRDDVFNLARRPSSIERHAWQHLQHHRLSRVALLLHGNPAGMILAIDDAMAALHAGRALLRIDALLTAGHLPSAVDNTVRCGLAEIWGARQTPAAAAAATHTADLMSGQSTLSAPAFPELPLLTSAFRDVAMAMEMRPDFFGGRRERVYAE